MNKGKATRSHCEGKRVQIGYLSPVACRRTLSASRRTDTKSKPKTNNNNNKIVCCERSYSSTLAHRTQQRAGDDNVLCAWIPVRERQTREFMARENRTHELMSMRPQNKHNNNYYYNELAIAFLCVCYTDVCAIAHLARMRNVSICL